ncbi:MAG: HEAT repeat domain-containing protein [Alphaproteobacteria bacterium]|nr:HEAT repeat domain-containing protein [Alphaproteobacteria bacterium]
MTRARLALAVGVALLAAVLVVRLAGSPAGSEPPDAAGAAPRIVRSQPAYAELGRWWRHAVRLDARQQLDLGALAALGGSQDVDVRVQVAGELELRAVAHREERTLLEVRWLTLDTLDLTLAGLGSDGPEAEVLRAAVLDAVVLASVTAQGEVVRVYAPDVPGPVAGLFHQVLSALQVVLPPGLGGDVGWRSVERSTLGAVATSYEPVGTAGDPVWTLERARGLMLSVRLGVPDAQGLARGGGRVRWDPQGWVVTVEGDETVALTREGSPVGEAHTVVSIALLATGVDAVAARAWPDDGVLLGRPEPTEGTDRAALRARAAGWTRERLLERLPQLWTLEGQDLADMLWQAAAFLQLHPEVCDEVGARVAGAGSDRARQRLVDLLVSVEHDRCAGAARKAVAELPADDPYRLLLLQRLGATTQPTRETARFLAEEHALGRASGDRSRALAAATGLGAMVEMLDLAGRASDADLHDRMLSEALAGATTPADLRDYARALGNTRRASHVGELAALTRHPDPEVRGVAAAALEKLDDPDATDALVDLADDPDDLVARRALRAWVAGEPTAAVVDEIAALVAGGRVADRQASVLVELARRHQARLPGPVDGLLVAMQDHLDMDGATRAAVRRLRERQAP